MTSAVSVSGLRYARAANFTSASSCNGSASACIFSIDRSVSFTH